MQTDYRKLWKLLIDRQMTRSDLRIKAGISSGSLAKLGKNENVTMVILSKICIALNCEPAVIMEMSVSPAERRNKKDKED